MSIVILGIPTERKPDSMAMCLSRSNIVFSGVRVRYRWSNGAFREREDGCESGNSVTCLTGPALVGKDIEANRGPEHLESPLVLRISAGLRSDDLRLEELVWLCRTYSVDQGIDSVHCGPPWQTPRALVRASIRGSTRRGVATSEDGFTASSRPYRFSTSLRMSFLAASHENITSTISYVVSSEFGAREK
jgi:hypothetical protein